MRKEVKEAAQLYGLLSIDLKDLLDVCKTVSEVREAIDYAEDFGAEYDFWCERQYKKHQEIKEAWDTLLESEHTYDDWEFMSPQLLIEEYQESQGFDWSFFGGFCKEYWEEYAKAEEERKNSYYTDEELQEAFDTFYKNRREQIIRIGKEAKQKHLSQKTMYRFIKTYHLDTAERTVFWLAYYGALV